MSEVFDNCDQIGDWRVYSSKSPPYVGDNTLEVDTVDKVEGTSLKATFGATGPNYGGIFRKRPVGTIWDFSQKPLMRIRVKLQKPLGAVDFWFEFVSHGPPDYPWDGYWYNIKDKLVVGEWVELTIDLRLPDTAPEGKPVPDLTKGAEVGFFTWSTILEPLPFNFDYITREPAPTIPPQIYITPSSATLIVGEAVTFKATVQGGVPPYSYKWYVNGLEQVETSATLTFTPAEVGNYEIKCVVTDAQGQTATSTASVKVLASPPPQPPIPPSLDVFKSEVRAVAVGYVWSERYNHSLIAQTLFDYGINTAYVDVEQGYFLGGDSIWNGTLRDLAYHRVFIDECHERGLRVIASFVTMSGAPEDMRTLSSTGEIDWLDVTKPQSREMLKAMVEAMARNYDFDGINFDYIRWPNRRDVPLGDEAKAKFIAETGLTDADWPTDVLEGGRYYTVFLKWRVDVITEIIRDMIDWAKAVRPDISIAVTPFAVLPDAPWYWVRQNAQDAAVWSDEGYGDFVSPMIYVTDPDEGSDLVEACLDYWTGGKEGKIPLIAWVDYHRTDPEGLVLRLVAMKNAGIDGWILTPYGGPGAEPLVYRDIRPYLIALHEAGLMEPIWAIQNFSVTINPEETEATVSWATTMPTRSRIEYSNKPMFVGTERSGDGVVYKDIDYIGGVINEDAELKTAHLLTIPIIQQTQFRIQSIDERGIIVTSRPMSVYEVPEEGPPAPPTPPLAIAPIIEATAGLILIGVALS